MLRDTGSIYVPAHPMHRYTEARHDIRHRQAIHPCREAELSSIMQDEIIAESRITEEEWDAELEFEGDIEPMEGLTESDLDD